MPPQDYVQNHRFLRYLGDALHDSNLWHINRHSAATAVFIGLFCAFMPIPFQMLLAAAMAIGLRGNLPVSVAVVWISNPITMAPMLYGAYWLGTALLSTPPQSLGALLDLDFNLEGWAWIAELGSLWQPVLLPLLLGSLICGVLAGGAGYALVKVAWRIAVTHQWRKRGIDRRRSERRRLSGPHDNPRHADRRHQPLTDSDAALAPPAVNADSKPNPDLVAANAASINDHLS